MPPFYLRKRMQARRLLDFPRLVPKEFPVFLMNNHCTHDKNGRGTTLPWITGIARFVNEYQSHLSYDLSKKAWTRGTAGLTGAFVVTKK